MYIVEAPIHASEIKHQWNCGWKKLTAWMENLQSKFGIFVSPIICEFAISRWQLTYFFWNFHPLYLWGNDPIWRAYFLDGLQPPTRITICTFFLKPRMIWFIGSQEKQVDLQSPYDDGRKLTCPQEIRPFPKGNSIFQRLIFRVDYVSFRAHL